MSSLLFTAADTIMKVANNNPILADPNGDAAQNSARKMAAGVFKIFTNTILPIILIALAIFAIVMGILKGIKLAKAESADQQEQAKKSLITFIIGMGIAIALTLVIWLTMEPILNMFGYTMSDAEAGIKPQ
ncbi:MAG: hypothetical protein IKQ31_03695 [Clostridia bacterium]|nr:hypothetical protein [Clostridia bacterium]